MEEWSQIIEQAIKRCREVKAQARKEHKILEALKKLLAEAESRPFALLAKLDQLHKLNSPAFQELAQLETALRHAANEQIYHYRDLLQEKLKADNCIVEGRFPEYRINKVVEVQINEQSYQARIGTRFHTVTVRDDISVVTIADAVREEVNRLFAQRMDNADFLNLLWRAYRLALTDADKRDGELVSIFTVHKFAVWLRQKDTAFTDASGRKFTPYLPDEFAVDIGRLLAENMTETKQGYQLQLHPVRNPREALFILNLATGIGQNYGFISFKRSKEG